MAGQQMSSNLDSWHLNTREVAYNLQRNDTTYGLTSSSVWKIYVPKIMPLIPKSYPRETVVNLQVHSMFLNTSDCMPSIHTTIRSRNYLEASKADHCEFNLPYKKHNTEFEIEVLHNNPNNLRITNNVDSSVMKPKWAPVE